MYNTFSVYMKFINRNGEMEFLHESHSLAKNKLFNIAIYGLRRVGKTRLVQEFLKDSGLYFFITKNETSLSLLGDFENTLREKKIITEYERINSWDEFFRIIFDRFEGLIAFDEFQNIYEIDKSVFGVIQKFIDLNENKKKNLMILYLGSTIGMIKKLFKDKKEPLYGRMQRQLFLEPLSFSNIKEMCKVLGINDYKEMIELYSVFGGFPLYYITIANENLGKRKTNEILDRFFLRKNAVFEEEVERILSLEFGKRKGRYYDILTAIAQGNTSISQIASYLSIKETKLTRYLNELVEYFEIVSHEKQAIGNKKLLIINNPIINFWFRFFYRDLSLYKARNKSFLDKIVKEFNSYVGKRFEIICKEFLEKNPIFSFDIIAKQWGKIPGAPKEKNQYEIDLIALNEKTKEILFCECKWQSKANTEKILKKLNEKKEYVQWNNEKRKESFAIFAKSFKKKVKEFEGKKVYCFDLKGIGGALKEK